MTNNIHVLMVWIMACAIIAAITTTTVPIVYSFFPWRSRRLGKLFMLQAVSFAAAMDLTVIFALWTPHILVQFWIEAIVFTAISFSTAAIAWQMLCLSRPKKDRIKRNARPQ